MLRPTISMAGEPVSGMLKHPGHMHWVQNRTGTSCAESDIQVLSCVYYRQSGGGGGRSHLLVAAEVLAPPGGGAVGARGPMHFGGFLDVQNVLPSPAPVDVELFDPVLGRARPG